MKKHIIIISLIFAFSLITTTNAIKSTSINHQIHNDWVSTPLYTISEFNGRLAVFNYNSDIPIEIYDINIKTLPDLDYKKLQKGVNVYTKESLYILIDEYTS